MSAAPAVLLAVAKELAEQAKSSLTEIVEGERILGEWYDSGVFYRETSLNGDKFLNQYDFRQRKSRRVAVAK